MPKYKLLKDLPGIKAGAKSNEIISPEIIYFSFKGEQQTLGFYKNELNEYPDWFEIVEEKWKPKIGNMYFRVASDGFVEEVNCYPAAYPSIYENIEGTFGIRIGNCFQTREEATIYRQWLLDHPYKPEEIN